MSRGSKDSTASIVSTTTAAKKNNPGPGVTAISGCNWMSATVNVSTNTSTMLQRPMIAIKHQIRAGINIAIAHLRVVGQRVKPARGVVAQQVAGVAFELTGALDCGIAAGVHQAHAHLRGRILAGRQSEADAVGAELSAQYASAEQKANLRRCLPRVGLKGQRQLNRKRLHGKCPRQSNQ